MSEKRSFEKGCIAKKRKPVFPLDFTMWAIKVYGYHRVAGSTLLGGPECALPPACVLFPGEEKNYFCFDTRFTFLCFFCHHGLGKRKQNDHITHLTNTRVVLKYAKVHPHYWTTTLSAVQDKYFFMHLIEGTTSLYFLFTRYWKLYDPTTTH